MHHLRPERERKVSEETAGPRCSIIVPVHGRAGLTRQCLDTILEQPPAVPFELIVVDDASKDETPQLLESYGDRIKAVRLDANQGFAGACNAGAEAARGELLVFLNNDTIPVAGWLDSLVDHVDAHPAAGIVGAKLLFPNETIQHAGVVICQDGNPRHLYAGFPAAHRVVNVSRRFQAVTAACMLVRRETFAATARLRRGLPELPRGHGPVPASRRGRLRGALLPRERALSPRVGVARATVEGDRTQREAVPRPLERPGAPR